MLLVTPPCQLIVQGYPVASQHAPCPWSCLALAGPDQRFLAQYFTRSLIEKCGHDIEKPSFFHIACRWPCICVYVCVCVCGSLSYVVAFSAWAACATAESLLSLFSQPMTEESNEEAKASPLIFHNSDSHVMYDRWFTQRVSYRRV